MFQLLFGIINRGGEQAAQHSQALHALFAHIPGLKVVMPSTAYDAKGLMVASILDPNPVIFVDDRILYQNKSDVPKEMYSVPIGEAAVRTEGTDITIVAVSYMAFLAEKVSQRLATENIRCEVVDLRTVKPLDTKTILNSVRKTGRVVIADVGWKSFGISAEIAAVIAESGIALKTPLSRLALPDIPAPASRSLEAEFYIDEEKFYRHVLNVFKNK